MQISRVSAHNYDNYYYLRTRVSAHNYDNNYYYLRSKFHCIGIRLFHCSQSEVIPNFSSYSGSASTANEVFCQTISGIEAGNLEWFSPVNTKLLADNGASGDPFYVQELPSETQLQRNNAGWPIENGLYRCALMGIDDYEYIALFDDTVGNSDCKY